MSIGKIRGKILLNKERDTIGTREENRIIMNTIRIY